MSAICSDKDIRMHIKARGVVSGKAGNALVDLLVSQTLGLSYECEGAKRRRGARGGNCDFVTWEHERKR